MMLDFIRNLFAILNKDCDKGSNIIFFPFHINTMNSHVAKLDDLKIDMSNPLLSFPKQISLKLRYLGVGRPLVCATTQFTKEGCAIERRSPICQCHSTLTHIINTLLSRGICLIPNDRNKHAS